MIFLTVICAFIGLLALIWMGWIDLKLWILPNELVALFAVMALPFHFSLDWIYGGILYWFAGALLGGGSLYIIRALGNKFYGYETMGLGDIKLMAAGGLWLGPNAIFMAMAVGAFAGVAHAIGLSRYHKKPLAKMMLPAGPGFIAGLLIIGLWTYKELLLP
jgi:Flp pilus assembly protein protease CpaA